MKKVSLKISGMHCSSCAMNIDGELEDTEGVKEACTSYAKGKTDVTYDDTKTSVDEMILKIKELDSKYDAKVQNE